MPNMEIQPQSSPKRKEPAGEEKLVQLDDLRTLLKEERPGKAILERRAEA